MKRISLDALLHTRQHLSYKEQYEYIMKLLEKGEIKPVKASKGNGKKPMLSVDYYLEHPDMNEPDRVSGSGGSQNLLLSYR